MSASYILIRLLNFVLAVVELFVVFRIILKLFGANPNTPFVQWIYQTSHGLVAPFLGIFPAPVLEGGFIIEFSSIFALFVYALVGYLIAEFLLYVDYVAVSTYRKVR